VSKIFRSWQHSYIAYHFYALRGRYNKSPATVNKSGTAVNKLTRLLDAQYQIALSRGQKINRAQQLHEWITAVFSPEILVFSDRDVLF